MSGLQSKPTQRDRVLKYIQDFGSITSWEAYKELGVTQLGARLFELEELDWQFDKKRVDEFNRYGEPTHHTVYSNPRKRITTDSNGQIGMVL